ncbi:6-bladed beta-propeller [Echinicola marina]|uniref:6-bladed beta-propeller n=1 Tax=Echinicola marina TaxID=2859768 RepID=UPI001CF608F9|nr:6-bladed beta-propeller [Echinicola marina]UCS95185.1 6-bladed beta-propeller [Echinicola marina]
MRHLLLALLICHLLSCESHVTHKSIPIQQTDVSYPFSKIFNDIRPIKLDDRSILGNIDRLIVTEKSIIILDFDMTKTIKIFDITTGKLIATKSDFGEGILEGSYINDLAFHKDTIYALDTYQKKLFLFDPFLKDIGAISISQPFEGISIQGKRIIAYLNNSNGETIYILNKNGKTLSKWITNGSVRPHLSDEDYFIKNDRKLIHYHPFIDTLYLIEKNKIKTRHLDFHGQFYPIEKYGKLDNPLERLNSFNSFQGYSNLRNGIELPSNELLFNIRYRFAQRFLLIDWKHQKGYLLKELQNDLFPSPSTVNFAGANENFAWYYHTADELQRFYQLNRNKIPEKERLFNSKDEINPVVFIATFKK